MGHILNKMWPVFGLKMHFLKLNQLIVLHSERGKIVFLASYKAASCNCSFPPALESAAAVRRRKGRAALKEIKSLTDSHQIAAASIVQL